MTKFCVISSLCFFIFLMAKNGDSHLMFENGEDPKDIHAVLVSGVPLDLNGNFDVNYAPEAEIAQTYHMLRDNGVPEGNIILFMNGKIAKHSNNPYIGLYTDKERTRDYSQDLKIDYQGDEVTPENFLAVIRGEEHKLKGKKGKVLKSTANSRLFISHESHGKEGILVFNNGLLPVKDLHAAFDEMRKKKMFKEMIYYVMACYSGSMFKGLLKEDGDIYALTAVAPDQLAHPTDDVLIKDQKEINIKTIFGSAWISDALKHGTEGRTLQEQYQNTLALTENSLDRIQQYGNLNIAKKSLPEFEGKRKGLKLNGRRLMVMPSVHGINFKKIKSSGLNRPISPISAFLKLEQKVNEKRKQRRMNLAMDMHMPSLIGPIGNLPRNDDVVDPDEENLNKMRAENATISERVDSIVKEFLPELPVKNINLFYRIKLQKISQLDCHDKITKYLSKQCDKIYESVFFDTMFRAMVRLCEFKVPAEKLIRHLKHHCSTVTF